MHPLSHTLGHFLVQKIGPRLVLCVALFYGNRIVLAEMPQGKMYLANLSQNINLSVKSKLVNQQI